MPLSELVVPIFTKRRKEEPGNYSPEWLTPGRIVEQILLEVMFILWPLPFSIFISNLNSGIERTLSKYADDTKLSGEADTLEGRDAIQKELNKLEKQACINLMRINKALSFS